LKFSQIIPNFIEFYKIWWIARVRFFFVRIEFWNDVSTCSTTQLLSFFSKPRLIILTSQFANFICYWHILFGVSWMMILLYCTFWMIAPEGDPVGWKERESPTNPCLAHQLMCEKKRKKKSDNERWLTCRLCNRSLSHLACTIGGWMYVSYPRYSLHCYWKKYKLLV
jgi:hypothetical protein